MITKLQDELKKKKQDYTTLEDKLFLLDKKNARLQYDLEREWATFFQKIGRSQKIAKKSLNLPKMFLNVPRILLNLVRSLEETGKNKSKVRNI